MRGRTQHMHTCARLEGSCGDRFERDAGARCAPDRAAENRKPALARGRARRAANTTSPACTLGRRSRGRAVEWTLPTRESVMVKAAAHVALDQG